MLLLKNLSKKYNDIQALAPVNLSVASGETKVLVGPSGCGKSTFIRLIIGLVESDSGEVHFNDDLLNQENLLSIRRKMGYVIQEGGLFPHLTVRDNITLLSDHLDWNERATAERIKELIDLTHFPVNALDRYPLQLSGGQNQRVSLMRALMLDPDVLLLDEPLGALDPMIRADLQKDLKEIFRSLRKAVIMVTHDINEAGYFADELLLMKDGIVVQRGTIEDMVKNPADEFVTKFIRAQHVITI